MAPSSSAKRRIAADRTSSPPAFFLPVSLRAWPIGAAARVFLWAWVLRVSRRASPQVSGGGGWEAAVVAVWLPAAPARRPAVKRPQRPVERVQVSAARVWVAALAQAPRPPALLVWHPAAASSDWGGWPGSPARSRRAERLSASLPAAVGRTGSGDPLSKGFQTSGGVLPIKPRRASRSPPAARPGACRPPCGAGAPA